MLTCTFFISAILCEDNVLCVRLSIYYMEIKEGHIIAFGHIWSNCKWTHTYARMNLLKVRDINMLKMMRRKLFWCVFLSICYGRDSPLNEGKGINMHRQELLKNHLLLDAKIALKKIKIRLEQNL